jgi:hypothetical protein
MMSDGEKNRNFKLMLSNVSNVIIIGTGGIAEGAEIFFIVFNLFAQENFHSLNGG